MDDIKSLLPQAADIRDATAEKENTALRVGSMFVNLINNIDKLLTDLGESLRQAIAQTQKNVSSTQAAAANAQSTANKARTEVSVAQATADTASVNAATAQSTADTARTEAAAAQSTADTARTEAAAAQGTADAAKEVTDTKDMPGGLASLDDDGFVPQYQLPVAVRNAVEFSGILQLFAVPDIETSSATTGDVFFIAKTGIFLCRATTAAGMKYYSNWAGADAFGTFTERGRKPALGKFYIDKSQGRQYFYDGSELVPVSADIAKRLALAQPVRCADEAELETKAASAEVGQQFYIPEED